MAVLTRGGERIPIAQVTPMFAMSVPTSDGKANSQAVQCTIFRINTPDGEVFTLPLHEIRAVHSISPDLLERLQSSDGGDTNETDGSPKLPFGLAAFAALPKPTALPSAPAPQQPTE